MKKDFLKYGNLVAFAAVVVFNVLAATGILGGIKTGDVSHMYHSLLAPADFAFSIWIVIYALLAIMIYRQLYNDDIRDNMGYLFIISCIFNVVWIFAWQFGHIVLSFIFIVFLLIDLIMLMKSMRDSDGLSASAVGLYTGWINVAMLANLGTMAVRHNLYLSGLSNRLCAILGLIFGLLWISYFIFAYSNAFYAVGACWGYFGILVATDIAGIRIWTTIGIIAFALTAVLAKNHFSDCISDCISDCSEKKKKIY